MSHSIPPSRSRVNITLKPNDPHAEKKKELPLKLILLGSFAGDKPTASLVREKKQRLFPGKLDALIRSINPRITIQVDNVVDKHVEELCAELSFNSMKDFSPDKLIEQVPVLKRLMAMRYLLKDLKSQLLENPALKEHIQASLLVTGKEKDDG